MDFFVGVDQDVALAERLVGEALTSCRYACTKEPWIVLVNQSLQDHVMAVRLRAKAYVLDVQYEKYEKAFESEVTRRVMAAFREHHVLPPALLHREL